MPIPNRPSLSTPLPPEELIRPGRSGRPFPHDLPTVFLDHRPYAVCFDHHEALKLVFQLRQNHHARRVSMV